MNIVSLNSQSFPTTTSKGTTLADFWAPWCGPCQQQLTILDQVAAEAPKGVTIAKVNIDESPELASRFGIRSIPTLVLLRDGQVVETLTGVQPASRLLALLQPATA